MGIPRNDTDHEFARWVRACAAEITAAPPGTDTAPAAEPGRVDRALLLRLGDVGLLPALFPGTADDGPLREAPATRLCLLREHLARTDTHAETALALQGLGTYPLLQSGTECQRRRWVPEAAAGRAVAAFALTEPDAGSDAAALALRAEPFGDGWRLHGEKTWISNAPDADFYTVFARTTPGTRSRGVTAFCVPGDRPGLSGSPLEMLSPHALGHLVFDGVEVGPQDVVGIPDQGFTVAMRTLDLFRPSVGAFAVGMADAALAAAKEHTDHRSAFGGPLRRLQTVAHTLAEMATRTEAARLLVYAAAQEYDSGGPDVTLKAAMAKLFATETAQYVVDAAVQLHGARALHRGHLLEHLYREVRAPRIYEGASEVQRQIIARHM
ncbi:acyl-CoA dehydrogenase family protein [Nocardiopsis exhalans]|uniref:Acyl-CoA dehydrogenase family protein n=1 Tax=Nocardiopsis exhalans TaxID=163604 RepID=A0ABY5D5D3_9ACTN|nr:acyl-CoA dehydrogenase family protein [Nocardiopsis exhalans]USY18595.1 acyl-CoA dehydrogenase family protein [Nocardiopsis exhalans]